MLEILSVLLFVISATLDNLVVGIAYGIKKLKISLSSNLLIALISCIGTYLSMLAGRFIEYFISSKNSNIFGSSILIIIGLWFILNSYKHRNKINEENHKLEITSKSDSTKYPSNLLASPEKADTNNSGNIELKEAVFLGIALALNNMGLGIGASIAGLSISLTLILTFIFSLTTIPLGYILGRKFLPNISECKAELISGLIIILLGVYELFT